MRLGAGVQITPNVRLLRHLAEGGMGSVWLAEHLALDCQVAVKFIMPELRSSCPSVVERFKREGKVAAQITSPHVVRVFDQGTTDDDTPYIVMELLRGDSLADWLSFVGPLSLAETARLVRQVTSVLERAHDLGVIHRDIKPANLFLVESTEELFVKVLDFGIAKATRLPAGDGLTVAGALMGTPDYMSPERLLRADGCR